MHGENFTNSTQKQLQLLCPLNNLEKRDPLEIETTYKNSRLDFIEKVYEKVQQFSCPLVPA